MILVGPAAGGNADHSAACTAVLGLQRIGDDGKFLHAVHDGRVARLQVADVVFRQDDAGSVDGNFVGRVASAADERRGTAAARNDACGERRKAERIAAVQRKIDDLFGSDDSGDQPIQLKAEPTRR